MRYTRSETRCWECDPQGSSLFIIDLDVTILLLTISSALVLVYKDLLSFYMAAHKILTSKSFVLALISDQLQQHLPTIVSCFLGHAESLRYRINNATSGLVADIKQLLQDNKSKLAVG